MFVVLGIIILGILIGTQIRSAKAPLIFSKMLNAIIYLLLLVMGVAVGGNETIVANLSTIGLKSLIITAGAILGSAVCALFINKYIYKTRK